MSGHNLMTMQSTKTCFDILCLCLFENVKNQFGLSKFQIGVIIHLRQIYKDEVRP